MDDVDHRLSKLILALTALGAALNLISSVRTRAPRRAAALFMLGIGLPAIGELLATGPLNLLRHRTRPRVAGVPVAILLGWYCATNGSVTVAENALDALPLDEVDKKRLLPLGAALVGTSLDLILDPAGLDAGLWEWNGDGAYANEVEGANGHAGVPLINYAGWLLLVGGVASANGKVFGKRRSAGKLPALLLLPLYLAAVAWATKSRRLRYLLFSLPFPVALAASMRG